MAASHPDSSAGESPLVHWRGTHRDTRGTYDIIALCASTLVICAWNAVHIDIPYRRTVWRTHGVRVAWFFAGLFMPVLLLSVALGQFLMALRISAYAREQLPSWIPPRWWRRLLSALWRGKSSNGELGWMNGDRVGQAKVRGKFTHQPSDRSIPTTRKHDWTMTHSYYALMGGFQDVNPDDIVRRRDFSSITMAADMSAEEIMARSKTGPLSKALLCIQIVSFGASCVARAVQHLPLSLLEITTIAHSLCALGAYAAWWYKPQDVWAEAPLRHHIPSLPRLIGSMYLNYTNDPHSRLPIVFPTLLIAVLYGAPHWIGRSVRFPTETERQLWFASSVLVIACPVLWATALYISWKAFILNRKTVTRVFQGAAYGVMGVYMVASVFLVSESVRQLFALPEDAFIQPQWTQYIPHFS